MAFVRGTDGKATFGDTDEVVGHLQQWSLDETSDVVEAWSMGDIYAESYATIRRWSGNLECYMDLADPTATIAINDTFTLKIYPSGDSSGSRYYTGTARVTGLPKGAVKSDNGTITINFQGVGPLTLETVA